VLLLLVLLLLHSQAHEQGLSPWQLPSVRSPRAKAIHPTTLSLDELHSYKQQYPYHLQQQRQERGSGSRRQQQSYGGVQEQQLQQQQQRRGEAGPAVVGRPGSAGSCGDYQPLLEQQLKLHQQQVDLCAFQLEQRERDRQQRSPSPTRQQQQRYYQHAEPWHGSGQGKGASSCRSAAGAAAAAAADTHWSERRQHILGGYSASSSAGSSVSGSTDSSPSRASAADGSQDVAEQQLLQQQEQALHQQLYGRWANKQGVSSPKRGLQQEWQQWQHPRSPVVRGSPAAAAAAAMPRFGGEGLPRSLAALVSPGRVRRGTTDSAGSAAPVTPAGVLGQMARGSVRAASPAVSGIGRQQQQGVRRVSAASRASGSGGGAGPVEGAAAGFSFGAWDFVGQ
jgi:hypothetical protein